MGAGYGDNNPVAGTALYWHILRNGELVDALGGSASPLSLNAVNGLFLGGVSSPHLRITVSGNTYSVFVDGSSTPVTTLTTDLFSTGRFALLDFHLPGLQGQSFDNVVLRSNVVPAPGAAVLCLIGLGLVSRAKRLLG